MNWEVATVIIVAVFLLIVALIASRNPKNRKVRFGVFVEREKFEEEEDDAG